MHAMQGSGGCCISTAKAPRRRQHFIALNNARRRPLLTVVLIAALGAVQVWVDKQEARRNSRVNGLCTAFFAGYSQPPAVGKWSKALALAGIRCVGLYALWLWPLRLFFDRATIRHNLTEFKLRWLDRIKQWEAESRPATESGHDQQFWGDLLDCFGVNARDLYLYQRSAKRASTGRTGKIDMFMPGKVIG